MGNQIETRVAGIPAIARVTRFFRQRPLGPSAHSDLDCDGFTEIEFDICDRRGRLAPWLERKASPRDLERIEGELIEHMEGAANER